MTSRVPTIRLDPEDTAPAVGAEVITKSDSVNFSKLSRGIYVGGAGDVAVVFRDGTVVTFSSVPAGFLLPVQAIRVNSTNTTATLMVALY